MTKLKATREVPGELLHLIGEEGASDLPVTDALRGFFLTLYNQRKSTSLNNARYDFTEGAKLPQH